MKFLTYWLFIVFLAVVSAGKISMSSTHMLKGNADNLSRNFGSLTNDKFNTSDFYRILHPDGRIQIVRVNKNKYVTDVTHDSEKNYQENNKPSTFSTTQAYYEATTSRPNITSTSAPLNASTEEYKVPIVPAFENTTPFLETLSTAPVSVDPLYDETSDLPTSSAYDDPTYVTSNVDLSTLFRETASIKFFRL